MKGFEKYIHSLIEDEIVPGISLLIGKDDKIVYKQEFGFKALAPQKEPLNGDTVYDLASLTKPLVTAFLLLYLSEREHISLETPVKTFFPGYPYEITLTQLLTHTSGLPSWYPFYLYNQLYNEPYFNRLRQIVPEARPGRRVEYSCVGYILLYYIIQEIAGVPFPQLSRQIIFEPLGLQQTYLSVPPGIKPLTAPTETGNLYEKQLAAREHPRQVEQFQWRDTLIRGETHDCNSYYHGGTAGNAGLFSTTSDIFQLTRQFYPALATLLKPATTQYFWTNYTPFRKSHRSTGFKLNSSIITSGGRALSRRAIGHNGFTGTSMWLEPVEKSQGFTFILLSNRVHPYVEKNGQNVNFNKIRRKLHRLMVKHFC